MSGRTLRILSLLIVAAALVARCDDAPEPPAPVQKQPWENRPAGADQYLASTRAAAEHEAWAASTRAASASTKPATRRVATRPAATTRAIDALTDPAQTVLYLYDEMRKDNFDDVRDLLFERYTSSQLKELFKNAIRSLARGSTVTVLDQKQFGSAAIVIYQSRGPVDDDNDTTWFLLLRRFDRWRILVDQPNPKRLAPEERKNFLDTMEWGTQRLQEILTAAASQPSSQPAAPATPGVLPALPPAPVGQ